jgi:hypothetical protein
MTVGKNHEPPAVYVLHLVATFRVLADHVLKLFLHFHREGTDCLTSFVEFRINMTQRLLDHLKEATFYSPKDLDSLGNQLKDCRRYVERGQEVYSPHLLTLLDARIKVCEETLATLQLNLSHLTPELIPKWDKLVSLLRSLAGCNTRSKFPNDEVDAYAKELYELEEELKKDGITAYESTGSTEDKLIEMTEKMQLTAANNEAAPEAKTLISQLLRRNLLWVALIKEK